MLVLNDNKIVNFQEINNKNRLEANNFLIKNWGSIKMAIHNEIVDMSNLDGFIAVMNEDIIGLLSYADKSDFYEIVSLNSEIKNNGIGTYLLNLLIAKARKNTYRYISVFTTNDNINAIRFYQMKGFKFQCLYKDAVKGSRKLKPDIPIIGKNGIFINDEIEFKLECT